MESMAFSFIPSMFMMIFFSVIPAALGLIALYFVIKLAVKNALKEHDESKLK